MPRHCLPVILLLIAGAASAQEEGKKPADIDLWTAAKRGDIASVQQALRQGVDVNSRTQYGATPLSYAAERGHLELVKLLVEAGADVNSKDDFYNASPLTWAAMNGHTEIVEYLKEKGAKPSFGRTEAAGGSTENPDETQEAVEFAPSSSQSRMADLRVSSGNWPQFRGTFARGVADRQHPPLNWNAETGENLKWRTEIPGLGHCCPVVWGDRLFVTAAISGAQVEDIRIGNYGDFDSVDDPSEHEFVVYCLDKSTGQALWQQTAHKAAPQVKRHLKSTHANPTCATDGEFVVAFFGSEGLYCYTVEGLAVWEKDLGFLDSGWFYDEDYQWGFGSSPVIHNGRVYVQCDIQKGSFIAALDLRNGEQIWRTERDEIPSWSTPTVLQHDGRTIVYTNGTRGIRAYDGESGEQIWTLSGNSEVVVPTPQVAHELVFFAAGYSPIQPIYAIRLDAEGDLTLGDGENSNKGVRWALRRGGPYMPTPIVYGDYLYTCANSGIFTCYQATTGRQVYRQRLRHEGPLSFVASPVAADGHVYLTEESGKVLVVKSGPQFELVGVNTCGEKSLATPAISEGVFYQRGQKSLFAFEDSQ